MLRDHMLITLNTHYRGATYAEAFNRERGELRCRVQWPGDPDRTATLTAVFVHLPDG